MHLPKYFLKRTCFNVGPFCGQK